jgi:hypothetical protein
MPSQNQLWKVCAKRVRAEERRSGYQEGIRYDKDDGQPYFVEVNFYPSVKWFVQRAEWSPGGWKYSDRKPLTPARWKQLRPLKL